MDHRLEKGAQADDHAQQFLDAARLAWPHVLAHTRRELSGRRLSSAEILPLYPRPPRPLSFHCRLPLPKTPICMKR